MQTRRELLGSLGSAATATVAVLNLTRARTAAAGLAAHSGAPAEVARDEDFWREVQQAFTADRSLVNLNNGGVSPSPAIVQQAMKRHLDYSNSAPVHTMWKVLEPQREPVRQQLATLFGCDPEEIALTRNTSESLETCQLGFDLEAGDEVLATTQDYPRMVATWRQLERRRKIAFRQFPIPTPSEDPAEIVRRYESHITPRTRAILVSHVVFLTGQVLPVRDVVALGRRHGIPVIVDGAHAFAHLVFRHADLDCDFYGTSLHKWLFAPHGTGMLYVRRDRIGDVWPLMAAPPELDGDIRKFEEIGTHPAANYLAIAEAVTFHRAIGAERKLARLLYLRDRWARRLLDTGRVRLHTSLDPRYSCALTTFEVEGVEPAALADHLWREHRIIVVAITHEEFRGIRVTPSVYTSIDEIDRFCEAVEAVIRKGLPVT